MKNRNIWVSLTGLMMAGVMMMQPIYAAPSTVKVLIDGKPLVSDQPAVIRNGRTMVPFNAIFSELGAKVSWNEKEQRVTGIKGDLIVDLFIGKSQAIVNGFPVKLDVPPQIINSRTMVPLKFVSSTLGAKVSWDGVKYIASVNTIAVSEIPGIFEVVGEPVPATPPVIPGQNPPVVESTPQSPSPSTLVEDIMPPPLTEEPIKPPVPPKDTSKKSNILAGTFAAENLKKEKFVLQFNSDMTVDIKSLSSKAEYKGNYSVKGEKVTVNSDIVSGDFVMEKKQYKGKDIIFLKDSNNDKNALAITKVSYEDFSKIWLGER